MFRPFSLGSRFLIIASIIIGAAPTFAEIEIGMSKQTVLEELGAPRSKIARGRQEIMIYDNSGRVVLMNDAVTSFSNIREDPSPASALSSFWEDKQPAEPEYNVIKYAEADEKSEDRLENESNTSGIASWLADKRGESDKAEGKAWIVYVIAAAMIGFFLLTCLIAAFRSRKVSRAQELDTSVADAGGVDTPPDLPTMAATESSQSKPIRVPMKSKIAEFSRDVQVIEEPPPLPGESEAADAARLEQVVRAQGAIAEKATEEAPRSLSLPKRQSKASTVEEPKELETPAETSVKRVSSLKLRSSK